MQTWTSWKRFPDARRGGLVEAPIGPGVYEVRHVETGEVVAFGHSGNVANALGDLKVSANTGMFGKLFHHTAALPVNDLEYRTCAAGSRSEAKVAAARLSGLRQQYWRKRMQLGWAARHSR
ncbi:MAG: hypothetical protein OJF62_001454 [Pseudolabrys sp.]|jgi:hypothetical protein|nr:hypothetical protein [Pseudolabrys sp.]